MVSVKCEGAKKRNARNRESGYGYRWNNGRRIKGLNLKTYVIVSSYRIFIFARTITNSRIMFARMLLNGLLSSPACRWKYGRCLSAPTPDLGSFIIVMFADRGARLSIVRQKIMKSRERKSYFYPITVQ